MVCMKRGRGGRRGGFLAGIDPEAARRQAGRDQEGRALIKIRREKNGKGGGDALAR